MTGVLRLGQVSLGTLAAFLEACAAHPSADIEEVARFADFNTRTAKSALTSLETLGLAKQDGNGVWRATAPGVARGMSSESATLVIRHALQGFRPFEALCEGLALGEDAATASRKAALALGLDAASSEKLAILLRWGADLGILEHGDDGLRLRPELQASAALGVPLLSVADLESEAGARLYNARQLGRDANSYLDEIDRKLLADALLAYDIKPRDSVENTGQAVEDFLREIAGNNGLASEAGKLNGIGQLANLLYSKAVIHNHHQKLADAVSTMRNASAHRKDKKTMTPWTITPLAAFSVHSTALTAIHSIHQHTTSGRQIL